MKRFVPAFGVPLILAVGLGQGDTRSPYALAPLPGTLEQALTPKAPPRVPRVMPRSGLPYVPVPHGPGDIIPHSYLVYGLRTGPGGMAFTDGNGAVIPVPSNPQIFLKPFNGLPIVPPPALPPTDTIPRLYTFPHTIPLPAPKK